jgi:hypothetical protein
MARDTWKVKCVECYAENTFSDSKDVTFAHWQIFGWNVGTGEPICICNKCEYGDHKKQKVKK